MGRPTKLFDLMPPGPGGQGGRPYDLSPIDGRFLRTSFVAEPLRENMDVSIVLNWCEALRVQLSPPP
jgi:hypothetical protein